MSFYLPVVADAGGFSVTFYAPVNGAERMNVYDAGGTPHQVLNTPDTTATLGGKLKVILADGVTVVPVAYISRSAPVPPVTLLPQVAAERGAGAPAGVLEVGA